MPGRGGGQQSAVPVQRTSSEAGFPRPWEAGSLTTPWSTVNLFDGNLITEIQISDFGTLGPRIQFRLYHNSAATVGGGTIASPTGFSLGAGWSVTWGGAIIDNHDGTVTLIEDDGNQYAFTSSGGDYEGPAGVHTLIRWDAAGARWVLTRPNQWQRIYDAAGRLIEVHDSATRTLTVERDPGNASRISAILSAAETSGQVGSERLSFTYDTATGLLGSVSDSAGNAWLFDYDAQDRLIMVTFPPDPTDPTQTPQRLFGYDVDGRITSITDETAATWTLGYDPAGGMLTGVSDPPDAGGAQLQQTLSYSPVPINNRWETYYTDSSNESWTYRFSLKGRMRQRGDAGGSVLALTYDTDGNMTSFSDDANSTVTLSWGPESTLTSFDAPYTGIDGWNTWNVATLGWEQPDPTGQPNFWRLTQLTDLSGGSIQYLYEDASDPTRPTTTVEQEGAQVPVFLDGSLNVLPTTGLSVGSRPFLLHSAASGTLGMKQGIPEVSAVPSSQTQQATGNGPYDWRWRFTFIFPPFGHIGIDFNNGSAYDGDPTKQGHVDYGMRPLNRSGCRSGCSNCNGFTRFTNAHHQTFGTLNNPWGGVVVLGRWQSYWHAGWSALRQCFINRPRNYGGCCNYFFFGGPAPLSNSNGGIHAAIVDCMGNSFPQPPFGWRVLGIGWTRVNIPQNNSICPGY